MTAQAPEVIRKEAYGVKADVFSFGVMLCEMVVGKYPWSKKPDSSGRHDEDIAEVMNLFVCSRFMSMLLITKGCISLFSLQGLRPEIPASCPESLAEMIQRCWQHDPDDRPNVDDLLSQLEDFGNHH
jgi:serine/threonine protein kinase